ncbi:MAG: hypothetical protein ACREFY_20400 [Acetobacteraceae bacterium]
MDVKRALACCESIHEDLQRRLPDEAQVFLGPALAGSDDPAIARLHALGAHFFWVAVPLGFGVSFWDAHAGIVVDAPAMTGTAGVHFRRGSADAARLMARCASALDARGLRRVISEMTDETQWNADARDISTTTAVDEACAELVTLLQVARRAAAGGFV